MGQPYIGEIRMFAGNFAPAGWMFCQGQSIAISENDALFNLIGTTYGGDGQETFNLPNLACRVPMHFGTQAGVTYQLGEMAGTESETITTQSMPAHTHPMVVTTNPGSAASPSGGVLGATSSGIMLYYEGGTDATMAGAGLSGVGGSQPHDNMQPYLCLNFIISLYGIYPSST